MSVPSFEVLQAGLGQTWQISGAEGSSVDVILARVHEGRPLTPEHTCYSLELQLPAGLQVAQGTYRLRAATGEYWDLLMTPVIPRPGQASNLEVVFHYQRSTAPA